MQLTKVVLRKLYYILAISYFNKVDKEGKPTNQAGIRRNMCLARQAIEQN
jgi:hypothetical protein